MKNKDILLAANILFNHRLNKTGLISLPKILKPNRIIDAYKIQNELKILYLTLQNNICIGKKIGCTNKIAQEQVGIFEPFYGKGAFYNVFENYERLYTEIDLGLDFFEIANDIKMDYIITNPPYSIFNKILDKLFLLEHLKGFGFLVNNLTITPPRLAKIEEAGFHVLDLYLFKINPWFGHQNFIFFKKLDKKPLSNITYRRHQYIIKKTN